MKKALVLIMAVLLIFGCTSRMDTILCSKYVQIAVDKNGLEQVHSCKDTSYPFSDGKVVHYVEIRYGEGEDCPSGCIYRTYSALVTEDEQIYPTKQIIPVDVGHYLSVACVDQNNLSCHYDPIIQYDGKDVKFSFEEKYKTSAKIDKNGIYWAFDLSDIKGFSGDCRKTCEVNGRIELRRNETNGISVEYRNITTKIGDFVNCDMGVYKDYCLLELAIAQNNATICQEINSKSSIDNCYNRVAMANEEPEYCEEITTTNYNAKRECFVDVLKITHDSSICKRFDTGLTSDDCEYFASWEHKR